MLSRQKHLLHEPWSLSSVLRTIKPEGGNWLHSYPDLNVPSITSSPTPVKKMKVMMLVVMRKRKKSNYKTILLENAGQCNCWGKNVVWVQQSKASLSNTGRFPAQTKLNSWEVPASSLLRVPATKKRKAGFLQAVCNMYSHLRMRRALGIVFLVTVLCTMLAGGLPWSRQKLKSMHKDTNRERAWGKYRKELGQPTPSENAGRIPSQSVITELNIGQGYKSEFTKVILFCLCSPCWILWRGVLYKQAVTKA